MGADIKNQVNMTIQYALDVAYSNGEDGVESTIMNRCKKSDITYFVNDVLKSAGINPAGCEVSMSIKSHLENEAPYDEIEISIDTSGISPQMRDSVPTLLGGGLDSYFDGYQIEDLRAVRTLPVRLHPEKENLVEMIVSKNIELYDDLSESELMNKITVELKGVSVPVNDDIVGKLMQASRRGYVGDGVTEAFSQGITEESVWQKPAPRDVDNNIAAPRLPR